MPGCGVHEGRNGPAERKGAVRDGRRKPFAFGAHSLKTTTQYRTYFLGAEGLGDVGGNAKAVEEISTIMLRNKELLVGPKAALPGSGGLPKAALLRQFWSLRRRR